MRSIALRACIACGLAAAAACVPAQDGGSGLRLGFASREGAGPGASDPVLQLKLRAGAADAGRAQAREAGAALDLRQPIGTLGGVRELTLYGAVRAGDWRWQASVTRDLGSTDVSVGLRVRRSF